MATTASGGMPNRIACRPKTGAMPRKNAEAKAAKIPLVARDVRRVLWVVSMNICNEAISDCLLALGYIRLTNG